MWRDVHPGKHDNTALLGHGHVEGGTPSINMRILHCWVLAMWREVHPGKHENIALLGLGHVEGGTPR